MAQELTANFGANSTKFAKGVQEIKAQLTELNKAFDNNKKELAETNKKVKEYEKELEQLKKAEKETGTATKEQKERMFELETAIAQTKVKAAELKTEQAELKVDIKRTTDELKNQKAGATDNSKALDKVKSSAADLGKTLATTAAGFTALISAVYSLTHSAAQSADDINTLSKQYGLSTEEIQKFKYATDLIDVSLGTYTASIARNIRSMTAYQNGTEATVQAYDTLGVAVTDANGKLRDSQTVYNEVINALGKIEDDTQRDSLAMTILGRSAQQLNPLILGGAEALEELGNQAESLGLILPQESLDNLNDFNDKVDTLKANMNGLKMVVAESFANSFDSFFKAGDELIEFVQQLKDDGTLDEMAKGLSDTLATLVNMLKSAVDIGWKFRKEILAGVVAITSFKIAVKIGDIISNTTNAVKNLTSGIKNSSSAAVTATAKINLWSIAISAAVVVIFQVVSAVNEATAVTREYNETLDSIEKSSAKQISSAEAEIKIVENKVKKYDELKNTVNRTAEQEQQLANLADELQSTFGSSVEVINSQTGAYNDLSDALYNYSEALLNAAKVEASRDRLKKLYEEKDNLEAQKKQLSENWTQADYDYIKNTILVPEVQGTVEGLESVDQWLNPGVWVKRGITSLIDMASGRNGNASDYIQYNQTVSAIDDITSKIKDAEQTFSDLSGTVKEDTEAVDKNTASKNNNARTTEELADSTADLIKSLDELASAYAEQEKNGSISYNTMLKLIDAGYAQCISLDNETGKIKLNAEAYKELAKAKLATQIAEYDSVLVAPRINSAYDYQKWEENRADTKLKRDALQAMYDNFDSYIESGSFSGSGSSSSSSSYDNEYKKAAEAYKTEADKKIALIKRELEAKKELRDETIKAIDDEIEARKRLNEDNDLEKQINEVKAQLKYSQLDEFSREQMEKKLQSLYDEKAETEWQRNAQARKDAANAKYETQQKTYNSQIDAINQSLQTVQEIMAAMADGSKSVESIINNDNTRNNTANINLIGSALTMAQITKAVKDALMDDIVIR